MIVNRKVRRDALETVTSCPACGLFGLHLMTGTKVGWDEEATDTQRSSSITTWAYKVSRSVYVIRECYGCRASWEERWKNAN
jgi:hypothetical protein